jgi:hypothetical protein
MANFSKFDRFPTEIRLEIWRQAATDPQVVDVRFIWNIWQTPNFRPDSYQNTTSHLKGLLGACQESRREVRTNFGRNLRRWGTPQNPVLVYFNPSIDTLWFPEFFCHLPFLTQFRNGLNEVRRVAYPLRLLPDHLADILHHVHRLERLYLTDISSDDDGPSGEPSHAVLLETKCRPEDDDAPMIEEVEAKYGDPLLVVTWKLVEEHIQQVIKERMTRDTSSDRSWTRAIPEIRIGRISCREGLRNHTWTLGCYCEYCQWREKRYPPGSSSSLMRLS